MTMEQLIKITELDLIWGKSSQEIGESCEFRFLKHLWDGEYLKILCSEETEKIFCKSDRNGELKASLTSALEEYSKENCSVVQQMDLLCLGIAALQGFLLCNWTGPKINERIPWLLALVGEDKKFEETVSSSLAVDGEGITTAVVYPELLLLAEVVLSSSLGELVSLKWWLLRCLYIHQQILDEHCPSLQERIFELSQDLGKLAWIIGNKELKALLHLEIARIHLHYGRVNISEKEIDSALKILGLEVNLVGALGKRTQYQLKDLAQLTVKVSVDGSLTRETNLDQGLVPPKDILLEDDVQLPNIAFTDSKDGEFPDLTPLEQAAMISIFVQKKKSQAKDRLQKEELMPYLRCLLTKPKVWSLQQAALLFRSRLECDNRRTIERALTQTQTLIECDSNTTPIPLRMHLFYCSYSPPLFVISSECASILMSVGAVQSALDIYLRLQMWEEIIICYNALKLRHKAAEVIQQQLKIKESVKLLCYLGDATDDVTQYEKAWELSGQKSAQPKRHWGLFLYNRKQYKESIAHFKESLQINSLQTSLWFRLGYAALAEHEWEESAAAYRRYCSLEPDSFEAWNNLAKAYILLGQKVRAYNALQEAVKCNYENWQVWDNLMAVSSDCGDFEEVIHCYHRILDLKDKHVDEQILSVLTGVIIRSTKDCKGLPASRLRKKALVLFGRITSKTLGNSLIWKLYSHLLSSAEDQTQETRSQSILYMQKAYNTATMSGEWLKSVDASRNVLHLCQNLGESYLEAFKKCESQQDSKQYLSSAKLQIRNVIDKVEKEHTNPMTGLVRSELENDFNSLKSLLDEVQAEIAQIQPVN